MKWTDPAKPTLWISSYDHVIAETPLGKMIIEWKSWKDRPSYDVEMDGEWIGCEYSLDAAKKLGLDHLEKKSNDLIEYLTK